MRIFLWWGFQNDEAVLRKRLHSMVEDASESRSEVVRRCAAVLREIARHKACGFFLFPIDETLVSALFSFVCNVVFPMDEA